MTARRIRAFVDLRCLQDPNYRSRGIGRHVLALLRHAAERYADRIELVGLLGDGTGELLEDAAPLLAQIQHGFNPAVGERPTVFVNASPMTHDPSLSIGLLGHVNVFASAVVYDFIPHDWPGYLDDPAVRGRYLVALEWLRLHDHYFPISRYSARRLTEICDIAPDRVTVTGAAVRSVFFEDARGADGGRRGGNEPGAPYLLVVGGDDARKNVGLVVEAMRHLTDHEGSTCTLKVVGKYSARSRAALMDRYGPPPPAGVPVEFVEEIEDEVLAGLYRGALAAVVPSRIEGFSLPIAEANACGCPVVASDCEAHLELVHQPDAVFGAERLDELTAMLRRVVRSKELRTDLAGRQGLHCRQFHERYVADRFWSGILARCPVPGPPARPRSRSSSAVAFLTPYPPQQSGVADFSRRTLEAMARFCDVHVYTNADVSPEARAALGDVRRIGVEPLLRGEYAAVVSVLGNAAVYHDVIFDFFEKYGGPCVLHDSRLLYYHVARLGAPGFLRMAQETVGPGVTWADVEGWIRDESSSPSLFLGAVPRKADPLVVHTRRLRDRIRREYGVSPTYVAPAPILEFRDEELGEESRRRARRSLGIGEETLVVATFGFVHRPKGWPELISALAMVRARGVPAELFFVGSGGDDLPQVLELVRSRGLGDYVHLAAGFKDAAEYRAFLLASDVAVQLRTYGFAQYSAALTDCISAGLWTIANEDLADAVDGPAYVRRVPDRFDAPLVAEAIADVLGTEASRQRLSDDRTEFLRTHNFSRYASDLSLALGLAG